MYPSRHTFPHKNPVLARSVATIYPNARPMSLQRAKRYPREVGSQP